MTLTFVVPVRNDVDGVSRCLRLLGAATDRSGGCAVLVIDNGRSMDWGSRTRPRRGGHPRARARALARTGKVARLRNLG